MENLQLTGRKEPGTVGVLYRCERKRKDELYRLAEKYSKDGVLSLSDMHKQNRLTELNGKFEKIIEDLGHSTEAFAKKNMQDGFKKCMRIPRQAWEILIFQCRIRN